jgi:hypothetical protein
VSGARRGRSTARRRAGPLHASRVARISEIVQADQALATMEGEGEEETCGL